MINNLPGVARFAPSATGPAHPGTLAAALLCWLDARCSGHTLYLRLEDLDPQRCTPQKCDDLIAQLAWFGLGWDSIYRQSERSAAHIQGLEQLVELGLVYACSCSRAEIRRAALPAVDGGWRYPGTCRARTLAKLHDLGDCSLRLQLNDVIHLIDANGHDCSQNIPHDMGDPIIRRRDGAVAYHLASVLDDAAIGVSHIVRGCDLITSTATQVALFELFGASAPEYRHHLLMLELSGKKLAKFHGSVAVPQLREYYSAAQLCGIIAEALGLRPTSEPCTPSELLPDFSWERVRRQDQVLHWDGASLAWQRPGLESKHGE